MTTQPADLLCECGAPLTLASPCASCGAVVSADDVGIVHLARDDSPWLGVPKRVATETTASATDAELVDHIVDGTPGWSVGLQEQLLFPASGVAATLVPLAAGASVLDLGTGWGPLAEALTLHAPDVSVVRADHVLARLRFNVLMHPAPVPAVHLDLDSPLPWRSDGFDAVFVDAATVERTHGAATRDRVLAEVCRILRPGGVAVVRVTNPPRVRGRANPRRSTRVRATVRSLQDPAGRRHLRRAGLVPRRVVVPYPALDDWRWLVPAEGLRAQLVATSYTKSRAARVRRQLLTRSAALRVARDAFVLARPAGPGATAPVRTLAEDILDSPADRPPLTLSLTDARVAVVGEEEFIKIPLSAHQQEALTTEVAKTTTARETAFAPFVLPGGEVRRRGAADTGLGYTSFPRVHERRPDPVQAFDVVVRALRALDTTTVAPLSETALWRRLSSDRGAADAEEMGVARLRRTILAECGSVRLPIGPSHGDLHAGNVMFQLDGDPLLVDWNRFELVNPLLLDAAYAAVRAHRVATRTSMAQAFAALADGEIALNLAERARALAGDLDHLHAASVVLLDRVASNSLPRRRHKPWTMGPLLAAGRELQTRMDERAADARRSDTVDVHVGAEDGRSRSDLPPGVAFPDRPDERESDR